MGRACGDGFDLAELYDEIVRAGPYQDLDWEVFERIVDFVAAGGYALKTYDRYHRIVRRPDGRWVARTPRDAQAHRMNVGAIVESPMLSVRLAQFVGKEKPGEKRSVRAGLKLGEMEEYFLSTLTPGDTFLFGGPSGLPQNLYHIDFDDPNKTNPFDFNLFQDEPLDKEATTAGGDSGGVQSTTGKIQR